MSDAPEDSTKLKYLDLTPEEQRYADAKKHQIRTLIESSVKFKEHLGLESDLDGYPFRRIIRDDACERMVDLDKLNELAKAHGGKLTFTLCNAAGEELDLAALYLHAL